MGWVRVEVGICLGRVALALVLLFLAAPCPAQEPPARAVPLQLIAEGRANEVLALLDRETNVFTGPDSLGKSAIVEAAAAGETRLVKRLLELGADVNTAGATLDDWSTPSPALHWAVRNNHIETCRVLLEAGADPNRLTLVCGAPLHAAFAANREEIAALLLDYGAQPFQTPLPARCDGTPFEAAIGSSAGHLVARMLGQEPGHPLGAKRVYQPGRSPKPPQAPKIAAEILAERGGVLLSLAAQRGEVDSVKALFLAGVTLQAASTGCPPVMQSYAKAINERSRSLAEFTNTLRRAQTNLEMELITSPNSELTFATRCMVGELEARTGSMTPENWRQVLGLLVEHGAPYDAFAATALDDRDQAARLLADAPWGAQARDCQGATLLHWSVETDHPRMLEFWLGAGSPVDATNPAGQTALHLAAAAGKAEAVSMLLAARAATAIQDTNGLTPVRTAIQNKQAECAHILLLAAPGSAGPECGLSTPLHAAAASGNLPVLAAILQTQTNQEAHDELGMTPLWAAVQNGHLAAAALLVDRGAQINARDPDGNTMLHDVIPRPWTWTVQDLPPTGWLDRLGNDLRKNACQLCLAGGPGAEGPGGVLKTAAFLLAGGIAVQATNRAGRTAMDLTMAGQGPFSVAIGPLLTLVRAFDPHIDPRDAEGNTPLHHAATGADTDFVTSLIAAGADLEATNGAGQTPLHLAAAKLYSSPSNAPLHLLLDNKANVNARDNEGRTPLHVLALADTDYKKEAADLLVAAGADLDRTNRQGQTARQLMAKRPDPFPGFSPPSAETEIHLAALEGNVPAAERLLKADPLLVNQTNEFEPTPLRVAAMARRTNMVEFLVAHGAVWDAGSGVMAARSEVLESLLKQDPALAASTVSGQGLLHVAVLNQDRRSIDLLLATHANVNAPDDWGVSPLGYALANSGQEIRDELRRHGARKNLVDTIYLDDVETASVLLSQDRSLASSLAGHRLSTVELAVALGRANLLGALLAAGADLDMKGHDPIRAAVWFDRPEMLPVLAKAGAKLSRSDGWGLAPLHWAAINQGAAAARFLLEHGVNASQPMGAMTSITGGPLVFRRLEGATPLHLAALCGSTNMVGLLLEARADVDAEDAAGRTPLDLASSDPMWVFHFQGLRQQMRGILAPLKSRPTPLANLPGLGPPLGNAAAMLQAAGGNRSSRPPGDWP